MMQRPLTTARPVPSGGGTPGIGLERLAALAELGRGRLDSALLDQTRALHERAEQRLARSREHVVVAFAGGTGSGKSSLLNAVLGVPLSTPGVRRPTTDRALAVSIGGGADGGEALLDWLQVFDRHTLPAEGALAALDGAILLDLPDIDSVVTAHWACAERLLERCDLLVWVVDPLKYAHALAHRQYFSRLAHHAELVVMVLNHVDRLAAADRPACLEHLRELLAEHRLHTSRLVASSAATGEGVDELVEILGGEVRSRRAPLERLRADVAVLQERAAAALPPAEALVIDETVLLAPTLQAIRHDDLIDVAQTRYQQAAQALSASALRRALGVVLGALWRRRESRTAVASERNERPPLSVALAPLGYGLLDLVEPVAQRLPGPAAERLRQAARATAEPLASELRSRLETVAIVPRRRLWWRSVGLLRGAAEVAAVVGALWLAARPLADWLALPPVPVVPVVGSFTWPPALLFGGMTASLLIGLGVRPVIGLGARRHRRQVAATIAARIEESREAGLAPVREELAQCRRLAATLRTPNRGGGDS